MNNICTSITEEFCSNSIKSFSDFNYKGFTKGISLIRSADKIFVFGIGHSGLFGKILSMKLNHAGLRTFTVFDEINPPFSKKDLFIAISQSGETSTIITLAEKAKKLGGRVLGISANKVSRLAALSDTLIHLKARSEELDFPVLSAIGDKKHQNLSGILFGYNMYVLFYALIIKIIELQGESPESIDGRHATLQ